MSIRPTHGFPSEPSLPPLAIPTAVAVDPLLSDAADTSHVTDDRNALSGIRDLTTPETV